MVPHHEQAVEMAEIMLAKSDVDARVVALAEAIRAAQQPEIDRLHGMLERWGADLAGDAGHVGHGDGMMAEADLAALEAAQGVDASRLFLEQIIVHHEGAVVMAKAELASGSDRDATEMAQTIVDAQTAEIEQMREILAAH